METIELSLYLVVQSDGFFPEMINILAFLGVVLWYIVENKWGGVSAMADNVNEDFLSGWMRCLMKRG